jgi:hypothetical protein
MKLKENFSLKLKSDEKLALLNDEPFCRANQIGAELTLKTFFLWWSNQIDPATPHIKQTRIQHPTQPNTQTFINPHNNTYKCENRHKNNLTNKP